MTLEDAIKNREDCLKYLEGLGQKASPQNVEAVRWSVRALKFMQSLTLTPPNEPMTIEQLREMDRPTPVWAEVKGKTIEGWDGYWCLCQNGKILAPSRLVAEAERMDGVEFYASRPPTSTGRRCAEPGRGEADGYADGELVYDVWRCGDCGYVEETDDPDLLPRFCPSCGRAMTPPTPGQSWRSG